MTCQRLERKSAGKNYMKASFLMLKFHKVHQNYGNARKKTWHTAKIAVFMVIVYP